MKRKIGTITVIGIMLVCGLLIGIIDSGVMIHGSEPPAPPKQPMLVENSPTPDIPQLTKDEEARTKQIVLEDSRVQEVLRGKNFTIEGVGVVHKGSRKIGACLLISLDSPFFIEYDWPEAVYREKNSQGYYEESIRHEAQIVDHLAITVDLEVGKVVSIEPWNLLSELELSQGQGVEGR